MREILFRAKRLDSGEWAYSKSIAANTPLEGGDERWFIGAGQPADQYIDKNGNMIAVETTGKCLFYAIDPETIGQYTGLTDKNDKKIFEGDIVRCKRTHCDGEEMVAHIIYSDCCFSAKEKKTINQPAMDLCSDFEVIGNIHDNPELLED